MRRSIWLVLGSLALLGTLLPPASAAEEGNERILAAADFVWEFEQVLPITAPETPGATVTGGFGQYVRTITKPPEARFTVTFPGAAAPTVEPGATHSFDITVSGEFTGPRMDDGSYTTGTGWRGRHTAAGLLYEDLRGNTHYDGNAVTASLWCSFDLLGNFVGCTESDSESEVFGVEFPDRIRPDDDGKFSFRIGTTHCGGRPTNRDPCWTEFVYRAVPRTNLATCDGKIATVSGRNGSYVGTNGNDVMVGTDAAETFIGLGGDDKICTGGGSDVVILYTSDDYVNGGSGRQDILFVQQKPPSDYGVKVVQFGRAGEACGITAAELPSFDLQNIDCGDAPGTVEYRNFEVVAGSPKADVFAPKSTSNSGVFFLGSQGNDALVYAGSRSPITSRKGPRFSVDGARSVQFRQAGKGVVYTLGIETVFGSEADDQFNVALDATYGGGGDDFFSLRKGQEGQGGPGDDEFLLREPGVAAVYDSVDSKHVTNTLTFDSAGFPDGVIVKLETGTARPRLDKSAATTVLGINKVVGTPERDRLIGSAQDDMLYGKGKRDVIDGRQRHDDLRGGPGNDKIKGGPGRDRIDGGLSSDPPYDRVDGGPDLDWCFNADVYARCDNDAILEDGPGWW